MQMMINFGNVENVSRFLAATNSYPFTIDVVQGRYTVNGRSMLGICSLNICEPVRVICGDAITGEVVDWHNEKLASMINELKIRIDAE